MPEKLVFRFDVPANLTGTSVVEDFELLQLLSASGLLIPRPFWVEPDGAGIFDDPFVVVEFVNGSVISLDNTQEGSIGIGVEACKQLARFCAHLHSIKPPFPQADPWRVEGFGTMLRHYYHWWRTLDHEPSIAFAVGYEWLFGHQHLLDESKVLIHGDLNYRNLLIHEGSLSAVVDWETWHVGHPAEDLAYCRPTVLASSVSWETFMGWYQDAGGMPVSEEALVFCEFWSPIRNAMYATVPETEFWRGNLDNFYLTVIASIVVPHFESVALEALNRHKKLLESAPNQAV